PREGRSRRVTTTARPRVPGVVVALVLAALLPPTLGAALLSDKLALLGSKACVLAIAALSLNLLMGYAGQISLGQFAFVGVGAFTTGIVTGVDQLRLPWLAGLAAAAAVGAALAFVVGLPALRLRGLYLAVVTVGVAYACWQSLFRVEWIGGGSAGKVTPRPYVGETAIGSDQAFLAVAAVLLVLVWQADRNLVRSRLGRAFQAIRADEQVAASFGVDVARYKLLAFTLSGAVAGIAGAVYGTAYGTVSSNDFAWSLSLVLVVIVVIGGLGSRTGVVVAAVAATLLPELLLAVFGEGIRGTDLVLNAALLMFTISRHPDGLAGAVRHAREERARKRGGEPPLPPTRPSLPALTRPVGMPEAPRARRGVPVLHATGVSVRFGGLQAVDDAELRVDRGTIVGLMGPNGAGKTTLFNAVTGALRPDSGRVELLGHDVSDLPAHARAALGMSRTFQLIGLAKSQSVHENLLIAQHLAAPYGVLSALTAVGPSRWYERDLRERADEVLEGLGFGRYRDTPVGRLSHGQQRIVEIGCALVTSPELVLLDEPSAGMSPAAAEDLAATLRDVRDRLGRTVLLIEHNVPLVLDVADELYVMAAGRVVADGEPVEVVTRPEVVTAYLGTAPARAEEVLVR
ncbi:MAG TPA: branched-chain amino acid ABC transporter ATP-binding protein/permease, partial [Mycobacteriales bacterium]|nr:branched-chain amino acid ABC transporter ATP-binding protein/permease [Mycobacteriales bacterium]